jgi:hypothetical protein
MGLFQNLGNFWNNITGVTAANTAADAQRTGIQNAQGMLDPYASAGQNAIGAQADLTGANGPEAQAAAVSQIQNNPMFQSLLSQGENSLLQNASATGGLRGGNTQAALAQFAPQMLNQQIQQRFQNLGGIAGQGLAATQQNAALAQNLGNVNASNALGNYNLQRGFIGDAAGFGMDIASLAMGVPPGTLSGMFGGGGGGAQFPSTAISPNQSPMRMGGAPRSGYGPGPVAF